MDMHHLHPHYAFGGNLGDGHFGTSPQFDTPFQKVAEQLLTAPELIWNKWLQLPRSRVEHMDTVAKNHRMFRGEPFSGRVEQLALFARATLHAAAAELRSRRARDGPRYAGYAWWPHS